MSTYRLFNQKKYQKTVIESVFVHFAAAAARFYHKKAKHMKCVLQKVIYIVKPLTLNAE